MADFLQLVENIQQEQASVQRIFSNDGASVRTARRSPAYLAKLAEAVQFVAEIHEGRRPLHQLQEAMGTSDFSNLFGDILDRQMLANYREMPSDWRGYIRVGTVRDFRTVNRLYLNGGQDRLETVAEQANYPAASVADGKYSYSVKKYGRRLPFSWEALVNDDLDAFRDLPSRLARAARRTEEYFATDLFAGTAGPDATFFASGNANVVTGNPVLSVPALQTAFTVLAAQTDSDGEPILIDGVHLVVPPALMVTAQNILNSTEIRLNEAGGSTNTQLVAANWMRNKVTLHVNAYLPIIASSSNANTQWYLFADPRDSRPAAEVGFLRGHEAPELFMKAPNAVRVGGGAVDPMAGDYDTDSFEYKVRHVLGGSLMDPKMAVASSGAGS